jgi:muconolactone D-isomerase
VEFLVRIELAFPPGLPAEELGALRAAEAEHVKVLHAQGLLLRLWRRPGRRANWGLWEAADATALHDAIESLPLFPYMDVHVDALAAHPADPGP